MRIKVLRFLTLIVMLSTSVLSAIPLLIASTSPISTSPSTVINPSYDGMRLGFWLTHPFTQMQGLSVQQWFNAYFLTEPYPSYAEILLTDYPKWTNVNGNEVQNYLQLLTLADSYPNIQIAFMIDFYATSDAWSTQLQKLGTFTSAVASHSSAVSVGIMTEYIGFPRGDKAKWVAVRDVINSYGLPMVNYRSYPEYNDPDLPMSEGFHDMFHTNYPMRDDTDAALDWATNPEYYVGLSARYWSNFKFEGTSNSDGQPRGLNQYSIERIVSKAVAVNKANLGTRRWVAICAGFSIASFTGVSGESTTQMWDNPSLRRMIWAIPLYQENYILSTNLTTLTPLPTPTPKLANLMGSLIPLTLFAVTTIFLAFYVRGKLAN